MCNDTARSSTSAPPTPPRNPNRASPAPTMPALQSVFAGVPAHHLSSTFHLFEARSEAHRALFHRLPRNPFSGRLQRAGAPRRLSLSTQPWAEWRRGTRAATGPEAGPVVDSEEDEEDEEGTLEMLWAWFRSMGLAE